MTNILPTTLWICQQQKSGLANPTWAGRLFDVPPARPYIEFGKRLTDAMGRNAITSRIVCDELDVDPETVRLWRNGSRMPHDRKMRLLARLVGVSEAVLRYGHHGEALPLAGGAMATRDEDERALLEAYRQLPEWAQRSLAARAAELLENFAPKNNVNPYGKRPVAK